MTPPLPPAVVLGINYPPEPTGVSPYTGALARGLTRKGHRTRVVTAHPHYPGWRIRDGYGQWTRRESLDDVDVVRVRHYVPRRPRGLVRLFSELTFGARIAFTGWGRPRVIVAVSPALFASAIALLRARLLHRRVPFVVWVQDLYTQGLSEFRGGRGIAVLLVRQAERWLLRQADHVVVIHDRFVPRVRDDLRVDADRISVVRNWTHLSPFPRIDATKARAAFGWDTDEIVALHSGNMGIKQGLENVVDAARLAASRGDKVRFVLVGDGGERAHLESLGTGIPTLSFIAPLDDESFARALQAADVLLVNERPGVAEMAVPSKLTSYFSAGRPVLAATDADSITAGEIHAAQAGLRVDAGAPAQLLDGVLDIVRDPARAAAFGSNAQRYRTTVLDATQAIDQFADILHRETDRSPKRSSPSPRGDDSDAPFLTPR